MRSTRIQNEGRGILGTPAGLCPATWSPKIEAVRSSLIQKSHFHSQVSALEGKEKNQDPELEERSSSHPKWAPPSYTVPRNESRPKYQQWNLLIQKRNFIQVSEPLVKKEHQDPGQGGSL